MRHYSAKVLLFGEYAIIQGSSALAIPFKAYSGSFQKSSSQYNLDDFYKHVASLKVQKLSFDSQLLAKDSKEGINYLSNIPVGYGLGSSGALTAAVFDRYFHKKSGLELEELKDVFTKMESFFHGASSGLDPLVSYLNAPILVDGSKGIELLDPREDVFQFYLLDTGKSRVTSDYVKIFLEKLKDSNFKRDINLLIELNKKAIHAYHKNDDSIISIFKEISDFEQIHFQEMIPDIIKPIYKKHQLKLCGAGGGGFFLGLCLKEEFKDINEHGAFIPLL